MTSARRQRQVRTCLYRAYFLLRTRRFLRVLPHLDTLARRADAIVPMATMMLADAFYRAYTAMVGHAAARFFVIAEIPMAESLLPGFKTYYILPKCFFHFIV